MSGVGFFELVILFMIGLVVLGPKRLPKVASQIGSWLGQARRMARVMRRQLEDELNVGDELKDLKNIGEELRDDLTIGPGAMHVPRDDDTYSPLHDESDPVTVADESDPVPVAEEAAERERTTDEPRADDEDVEPEEARQEATGGKPA